MGNSHSIYIILLCIVLGQLLVIKTPLRAQNLVPNNSFENIVGCPTQLDQLKYTKTWDGVGITSDSPDLFNECAEGFQMGVPNNLFGNQIAKEGQGYAGLICYMTAKSKKNWKYISNHREFVMTRLLEPLKKDKEYRVSFSISLAEFCEFSVNDFGLLLTNKMPPIDRTYLDLSYYKPQIRNHPDTLLNKTDRWIIISGLYKAIGGEQFITIGTFTPDKELKTEKNGDNQNIFFETMEVPKRERPQIAYYFLDDIVVESLDPDPVLAETPSKMLESNMQQLESPYFGYLQEGDKVILNNIYFEFDKSVLLPESYVELKELLNFLNIYSEYKIKITGHTDNKGSDDYNLKLSLERAIAVARYLYQNGIPLARLEYEGRGSRDPIASNDTEIGQAKNRRVEFEILGKY